MASCKGRSHFSKCDLPLSQCCAFSRGSAGTGAVCKAGRQTSITRISLTKYSYGTIADSIAYRILFSSHNGYNRDISDQGTVSTRKGKLMMHFLPFVLLLSQGGLLFKLITILFCTCLLGIQSNV